MLRVRSQEFNSANAATITDIYKNRLPTSYLVNPISAIQVLSPTKRGTVGTVQLNKYLQYAINPPGILKTEYTYGQTVFRVGDKVMQTKNNYDIEYKRVGHESGMGVFNGDMGIITSINTADKCLTVTFDDDRIVEYPFNNLDELDLAYAITVHKSQGSEFPTVIMPVCNFAQMLMSRNLFYTAVTRAKDRVVLVGSEKTVYAMTKNNSYEQRFTGLNEKLTGIKAILDANEKE